MAVCVEGPGSTLVVEFRCFCGLVCRLRLENGQPHGYGRVQPATTAVRGISVPFATTLLGNVASVVRTRDGAVGPVVGDDQSGLPRCGQRTVLVGPTPSAVLIVLHYLLRQRSLVRAAIPDARSRRGAGLRLSGVAVRRRSARPCPDRLLLHHPLSLRDGLPRRAGAAPTCCRASDVVLSGAVGGRRSGGNLRRSLGAADLPQLLRTADRTFQLRPFDAIGALRRPTEPPFPGTAMACLARPRGACERFRNCARRLRGGTEDRRHRHQPRLLRSLARETSQILI